MAEIDRAASRDAVGLTVDEIELVEAIMDGESFRTIGLRFLYAESSAHKVGRVIVERALKNISEKLAA